MVGSGKKYWETLSFDERVKILEEGEFFKGFANHLWEYLPALVKIYINTKAGEAGYWN